MQAGRKKPDRLKNELAAAELEHATKTAEVQRLLQTQEVLVRKQLALDQIVASYATMACIFAEHGFGEHADWQVQQTLQLCLEQIGGVPHAIALQPHALDYMRIVYNPNSRHWVQGMSDAEILQHVQQAMGKCAIMVLQDQADAAWMQQHPAGSCTTSGGPSAQQAQLPLAGTGGRRGGHPLINRGLTAGQQGPYMAPASTAAQGVSDTQPSSSTVDSLHNNHNTSGDRSSASVRVSASYTPVWGRGPAFEISVTWGLLFTWDTPRFMRLISLDLETGQELKLRHGPGFGKWVLDRLCLTPEQVLVLKGLRDLIKPEHEHLPATIQQASVQQQALTQRQQLTQWASSIRSAGQVYEAQEQALGQQQAALDRFRTLAKLMGVVTLNTLTPGQLAVLHACSWPAVCRIEPVLDVLDDGPQPTAQQ